jgi:hypothetical protein
VLRLAANSHAAAIEPASQLTELARPALRALLGRASDPERRRTSAHMCGPSVSPFLSTWAFLDSDSQGTTHGTD